LWLVSELEKRLHRNFEGPFDGLICPTTEEGQWTYYTNDCKCLKAKSCDELKGTNCGWCTSLNRALLGDKNSPFWDVKCPIVEGKQWIFTNNCKCLTVNKCEDTGETENCGWCPSLKRGFIGNFEGPFDGLICPTTEEGQWTYYTNDCKCLTAKTCDDLQKTNCGWCNITGRGMIGNYNNPDFNAICPNEDYNQWIFNDDCAC